MDNNFDEILENNKLFESNWYWIVILFLIFGAKRDKGDDSKCTEIHTTTNNNDTNQLT